MDIKRSGSQPSAKGPADWFTGTVRIDPLFPVTPPARAAGNTVTFEPGARTAWHTHPLGQTLIVIAGCGRVQRWGEPIEEIRPGDVVWFPPGEKHWHGAAPTTAMTHIAIQEQLKGEPFQENMVESAKATMDHFGKRIVYINVLRNMSVDCDCAGVSAAPVKARNLGILASTDILAVEQASIDMVYKLPEAELHDLRERIESRKGLRQLLATTGR